MPTRSHPSFFYNKKNKPNNWFVFFGGGGGIRSAKLRFAITPGWQTVGVHRLSATNDKE